MLWYYMPQSELFHFAIAIGSIRLKQSLRPTGKARRPKSQPARHARPSNLFEKAFHNSPAIHSIVRFPDNVIVEVNDAFARTLGYRREDVIGKTPFDLQFWVTPEKLPVFREQLQAKGFVRNFELDIRSKDGS